MIMRRMLMSLVDRSPLLSELLAERYAFSDKVEEMIRRKKEEWRRLGYSESLISMAEEMARGWVEKMVEAFAPPELRSVLIEYNMEKALDIADRWIRRMHAAKMGYLV